MLLKKIFTNFVPYTKEMFGLVLGHISTKKVIEWRFKDKLHKNINWENPQDINEKINWLKLYGDSSKWSDLSDKYLVRDYVKSKGLGNILVKLYGIYDNYDDIDFSALPDSYVIKTNHGSGEVILVKNNIQIQHNKEIRSRINKWLKRTYGYSTGEPHYAKIKPKIIIEELLHEEINVFSSSIIDYKIWCFNGKPYSIWAAYNRKRESVEVATYDLEWNFRQSCHKEGEHYLNAKTLLPKPTNLDEMLSIAAKLSEGFPVVRVDLYNTGNKVYFGEMTFTSNAGYMTFYTDEYLIELGNQVELQNKEQ